MPTDLGPPYTLEWRGDPPHMLKPDIPVWYRFLDSYGSLFDFIYYDVAVGGPYLTPDQENDPLQRSWRRGLVKRIDAVVDLPDETWIIEVSADPGLRSIGQLISYKTLWDMDPKIGKPERLLLVAQTIEQDLLTVAGQLHIQCYQASYLDLQQTLQTILVQEPMNSR